MNLKTHLAIDRELCGEVIELKDGYAKVKLATTKRMAADEVGLVHGGFTFGAADFAAMAAINDPYVVLVSAKVDFLAPVVVGQEVIFDAHVVEKEGKRGLVEVVGRVGGKEVFKGTFSTYLPKHHILCRD